jgi:hypothetical protein
LDGIASKGPFMLLLDINDEHTKIVEWNLKSVKEVIFFEPFVLARSVAEKHIEFDTRSVIYQERVLLDNLLDARQDYATRITKIVSLDTIEEDLYTTFGNPEQFNFEKFKEKDPFMCLSFLEDCFARRKNHIKNKGSQPLKFWDSLATLGKKEDSLEKRSNKKRKRTVRLVNAEPPITVEPPTEDIMDNEDEEEESSSDSDSLDSDYQIQSPQQPQVHLGAPAQDDDNENEDSDEDSEENSSDD